MRECPVSCVKRHRKCHYSSQRPEKLRISYNVGRLRLFLQNITFTYDLANGTAQNNLNGMHVNRQCISNDN